MRWIASLALATFSLFSQAAALVGLPFETQFESCDSARPPSVELREDSMLLRHLNPDQRYVIQLREYGIDLLIAADDSDERWINSDPMGYATETLLLRGDTLGTAAFRIRVSKVFSWAKLTVVVTCLTAKESSSGAALLRRATIGKLMASTISSGDRAAALGILPVAAALLWLDASSSNDRLWVLLQLAKLASWGGLSEVREAWLRQARELAEEVDDGIAEAWTSTALGAEFLKRSDLRGDEEYQRAIRVADRLALDDISAQAANGRCVFLRVAGDAESAAACYLGTIARFKELVYPEAEASARISRATSLLYLGFYQQARGELELATLLASAADDESTLARVALVRAQVARWDGDFELALALLAGALDVHQKGGRAEDVARVERQIAQTYELAHEPLRAEHFFRSSLASAERRGDQDSAADIRVKLARLDAARGNFVSSLDLLHTATTLLARSPDSYGYAYSMLQLAVVQRAADQPQAARSTLRKLASSAHSLQWRNQVRVDALRLQLDDAPPDFNAENTLEPAARQALAKGDLALFLDLAEALLAARTQRSDKRAALSLARLAVDEGVRVAARVQSPAMRNALLTQLKHFAAAPLWHLPSGHVAEAVALEGLADLEMLRAVEQQPMGADRVDNDTFVELERLLADVDDSKQAGSPRRERLILQLTAQDARDRLRGTSPLPNSNVLVRMPALPSSMGALLYLVIDGARAGAMTFDERGWRWRGDLDAAAIRTSGRALHQLLRDGYTSRDAIDAQVAALESGLKLSDLFDDAPEQLSIVFDASLAALPWAMLPAPGDSGGLLADSSRLVMLQSLRGKQVARFSALHLGVAWTSSIGGLPELAGAAKELQQVAAAWPMLPQYGHALVSRVGLADALAVEGALVHLAAHGRGDSGRAEDAGLWLADDGGKPTFVSALRLRRMSVGSELVVLGACESGASESGRSLGVGGVGGSLVDAGAGAVVATRWPVSDRVALAFAEVFHRALAANPQSPEAALQAAVLELRRAPFARHPTHWAGWFLIRGGPSLDGNSGLTRP